MFVVRCSNFCSVVDTTRSCTNFTMIMRKRFLVVTVISSCVLIFDSTTTRVTTAYSVSQQQQHLRQQHRAFVPRTSWRDHMYDDDSYQQRTTGRTQQHLPFAATVSSDVEDTAAAAVPAVPTVKTTVVDTSCVSDDKPTYSFIQTELRGAAMKLHTKVQSPKEGTQVETVVPTSEPYITTHADYLRFLIDSQHVYQAMEDIVLQYDILQPFRNTGLERVVRLEQDILFMMDEYSDQVAVGVQVGQQRPSVGAPGREYAQLLHTVAAQSIPAFICHYYNHYFAHTAGGRMIGKQMSALLLNKKTLEFYTWDEDLNTIKDRVKQQIEEMACCTWNNDERQECVNATKAAFMGGGAINAYLSGRYNNHTNNQQ